MKSLGLAMTFYSQEKRAAWRSVELRLCLLLLGGYGYRGIVVWRMLESAVTRRAWLALGSSNMSPSL
jgi:hypothetical protein